ncbi:cupin family protein, partial [Genlisea aurea]
DKDFENCNGWIGTVTGEKLKVLKGTNFALFTVEMGIGSMMGPRWNPAEDEISVVLQGRGMLSLLCSDISVVGSENCRNRRLEVEEGDVFLIPKFHTVAQTSFNNDTLVFMGFTSYGHRRRLLKGPVAVLRRLDADVLATALDVSSETAEKLVAAKDGDSPLVACVSCAEEEWETMQGE